MSSNVGVIDLELLLNTKKYSKQLKNISNISNNTSSVISNSLSKIGKAALTAFSVKKLFDFGKECIDLGSDLAEVQNVVDVSFSTMSDSVNKFAETAIEQFGLGQTVTKKYMGTFGAMSKAFGFTEQEAYSMSETLTGLAGDVASFYNLSSDEAYTKLKSVFTGETETLKDLGVVMTQSALDQYALANGYGKTTSAMSEQEKVALRFKFVTDQLSIASGDFVRTQDGWANQTRVLSLRFNELKATLGQGFINIFTPIVKGINLVISKLQVLANAFKSFTDMVFGNAGGSDSSSTVSNIAAEATDASDAVSGIGTSAKKTAKDLKSLASFDTAQILKTDSSDDNSSSSGSGGLSGITSTEAVTADVNETTKATDGLLIKFKELSNIFKEGFEISFGDTNFDQIYDHIFNIKNDLVGIWADPDVIASSQQWADTMMYSLGEISGAIVRGGKNAVELLIGSIDTYLEQNSDRIKEHLCNMFDISSENFDFVGKFFKALGEISDVLSGDTAKQIGADLIAMFANPFMSITEYCSKFVTDLEETVFQPIIDNTDRIKIAIENTLEPVQNVTGTISESFTQLGDNLNKMYDEHIAILFDNVKIGLSDSFGKFLDAYNQYIAPALQRMSDKFSEVWEQHIQPMLEKMQNFVGKLADLVNVLWENCIKPAVDWFNEKILPVLIPIFESLWKTVCDIFADISDIIGGIIDVFSGLIDFIVGVFTGDWEKAWDGVKTIFTGIWDTISNFCKTIADTILLIVKAVVAKIAIEISLILTKLKAIMEGIKSIIKSVINWILAGIETLVNGIIKGLNKAISALNNLSFDVPDWIPGIGGNKFGLSIPKMSSVSLPRLADGGYFKANQPTLAIVGDNKRQDEIVSPMDKMEEAVENVLNRRGLGDCEELISLLKQIISILQSLGLDFNLYIDGYELDKRLEKIRTKNKFARNGG